MSRKEEERIEQLVRSLVKLPENRTCINCGSVAPQSVCTTFSTVVCVACTGVHRELQHRIKSVSMSKFTSEEAAALQSGGNEVARQIFLKEFDMSRNSLPSSSDLPGLRDFIRAVYIDRRYSGRSSALNNPHASPQEPTRSSQASQPDSVNSHGRATSFDSSKGRKRDEANYVENGSKRTENEKDKGNGEDLRYSRESPVNNSRDTGKRMKDNPMRGSTDNPLRASKDGNVRSSLDWILGRKKQPKDARGSREVRDSRESETSKDMRVSREQPKGQGENYRRRPPRTLTDSPPVVDATVSGRTEPGLEPNGRYPDDATSRSSRSPGSNTQESTGSIPRQLFPKESVTEGSIISDSAIQLPKPAAPAPLLATSLIDFDAEPEIAAPSLTLNNDPFAVSNQQRAPLASGSPVSTVIGGETNLGWAVFDNAPAPAPAPATLITSSTSIAPTVALSNSSLPAGSQFGGWGQAELPLATEHTTGPPWEVHGTGQGTFPLQPYNGVGAPGPSLQAFQNPISSESGPGVVAKTSWIHLGGLPEGGGPAQAKQQPWNAFEGTVNPGPPAFLAGIAATTKTATTMELNSILTSGLPRQVSSGGPFPPVAAVPPSGSSSTGSMSAQPSESSLASNASAARREIPMDFFNEPMPPPAQLPEVVPLGGYGFQPPPQGLTFNQSPYAPYGNTQPSAMPAYAQPPKSKNPFDDDEDEPGQPIPAYVPQMFPDMQAVEYVLPTPPAEGFQTSLPTPAQLPSQVAADPFAGIWAASNHSAPASYPPPGGAPPHTPGPASWSSAVPHTSWDSSNSNFL